jgi:hypothetical protein
MAGSESAFDRNFKPYNGSIAAGGAFHGAAAWSAYAVVEFVCSSVLFRLTRPYSVFTPWHWKLTALLLVGFLTIGPCRARWRVS